MPRNPDRGRAATLRWHTAAQVLATLRRVPGITRAALARELGLTSGLATEIVARLRDLRLLTEAPAPVVGRGRPTTVLRPHPEGPVVLALALRQEDWRAAVATVDGRLIEPRRRRHPSREPDAVLATLRRAVDRARDRYGHRLRAVSLAVAGAIYDDHLVQAATLGWGAVDLRAVARDTSLPLLLGNDATLAGVAEARAGAATTAGTALHLIVEVGVGGTLTIDGRPVTGAHGAAGEYGHLPFGDRALRCPCGARGCWDLAVDGRALARHLGEPPPVDALSYAWEVIRRATGAPHPGPDPDPRSGRRVPARDGGDPAARRAVDAVAAALGDGIAALVNLHDPDLVTLGGLGPALRRVAGPAFDDAYAAGLMSVHRAQPPPVVAAAFGDEGPLHGAAVLGLDHITGESALAEWAAHLRSAD